LTTIAIKLVATKYGDKRATGDVDYHGGLAEKLAGQDAITGVHELNLIQAGMANMAAFFGSDSMKKFLTEREALKGGATMDEAVAAGVQKQNEAADNMKVAAADLAKAASKLGKVTGTRVPGQINARGV